LIHENMSNREYHSLKKYLSNSGLKNFERSPEYFQYMLKNGKESAAMRKGTAFHTQVIEPRLFSQEIIIEPAIDKRTKAGKEKYQEFLAKSDDKTIISEADKLDVIEMEDSIFRHSAAKRLIEFAEHKEISIFTDSHPEFQIPMKIRPDLLCPKLKACVDLKSTTDASRDKFKWDVKKFGYHKQAAFYLELLEVMFPGVYDTFIIIACESSPPYGVAIYEIDEKNIDQARREMFPLLRKYKECLDSGVWGGYSSDVLSIGF